MEEEEEASGRKRPGCKSGGESTEVEARKRQRLDESAAQVRGEQLSSGAVSLGATGNSFGVSFPAVAGLREQPLGLQANASTSYTGMNFLRFHPNFQQYPNNEQIASLLGGQARYPGLDYRNGADATTAANASAPQLLGNLGQFNDINRANMFVRQGGLTGLGGMQSFPMVHPLLQNIQRQDNSHRQLGRLLGAGNNFREPSNAAAIQLSMYNMGLINSSLQGGGVAGLTLSRPPDTGPSQRSTLPHVSNNTAGALTAASESSNISAVSLAPLAATPRQLPTIDEAPVENYTQRTFLPLGIEEDNNWLSELHCLVRLNFMEVFRAGRQEVASRSANKKIAYLQVGVRCRYCAHLPSNLKAARSSAFPSSIRQIYQSFTMMLRDHFAQCMYIPEAGKVRFKTLKTGATQGASHSKHYWYYSAKKVGLIDTDNGIVVNEDSLAAGKSLPPFGSHDGQATASTQKMLVVPEDRAIVDNFLYMLMSQACLVNLLPSEQIGCRKSLKDGMPGFGCRHCAEVGWLGLSRIFPARRRTLKSKIDDLYSHLKRCARCPSDVKILLERLERQRVSFDTEGERLFFDQIWSRLGHDDA